MATSYRLDEADTTPLSDVEAEIFNDLISGDYDNFGLIRGQFDGKDVAIVVAVERPADENGENAVLVPLAVLLVGTANGQPNPIHEHLVPVGTGQKVSSTEPEALNLVGSPDITA